MNERGEVLVCPQPGEVERFLAVEHAEDGEGCPHGDVVGDVVLFRVDGVKAEAVKFVAVLADIFGEITLVLATIVTAVRRIKYDVFLKLMN